MFLDQVLKDWIAQCHAIAKHHNEAAAKEYLAACQNWAMRHTTQGVEAAGPEPRPPMAVEAIMDVDSKPSGWSMELRSTGKAVSTVLPSSFLPKTPTDVNAIGAPVGGPILDEYGKPTRRYYDFSSANSYVGREATIAGKTYRFKATSPFNRFWEEVQ